MKKIIRTIWCLALLAAAAAPVLAVWPPATALEEEPNAPLAATPQRASGVVDRLEVDERRFAEILDNLEKDQKKFKRAIEKSTEDSKAAAPAKEDGNGHRVR